MNVKADRAINIRFRAPSAVFVFLTILLVGTVVEGCILLINCQNNAVAMSFWQVEYLVLPRLSQIVEIAFASYILWNWFNKRVNWQSVVNLSLATICNFVCWAKPVSFPLMKMFLTPQSAHELFASELYFCVCFSLLFSSSKSFITAFKNGSVLGMINSLWLVTGLLFCLVTPLCEPLFQLFCGVFGAVVSMVPVLHMTWGLVCFCAMRILFHMGLISSESWCVLTLLHWLLLREILLKGTLCWKSSQTHKSNGLSVSAKPSLDIGKTSQFEVDEHREEEGMLRENKE